MDSKTPFPGNDQIAEMLDRIADLLEVQHASVYRIRAYRSGARSIRNQGTPLSARIGRDGPDDLESLPGIGKSLAAVIREFVTTGRAQLLERLEGHSSPADLFASIPGIGKRLADRIEAQLHIESLEDLEAAAHDGRLEGVPGFGARRVRGVRESLAHLLRFSTARRVRAMRQEDLKPDLPPVALLLEVDRRYFDQLGRGELRRITPRRFNPEHRAWLPVLHCELGGWTLTAMFSNTARAHQLGHTGDWVVAYYERDGLDGQSTIVTEYSGPLKGMRVVRGRETECEDHYATQALTPSTGSTDPSSENRVEPRRK